MHVLLAVPRYVFGLKGLHLGLAYVAAVLREAGISVTCLDASVETKSDDDLQGLIASHAPDVIGISCTASNYADAAAMARLAKAIPGRTPIVVVGGPQTTFTSRTSLEYHPEFDIIVRGEGEFTMRDLLNALASGSSLGRVPGITYRDSTQIVETDDRAAVGELDALPFPARELFPSDRYAYAAFPGKRATSVITSRGCAYKCIFCTQSRLTGKPLRLRSVENVTAELELVKKQGFEAVYFEDSTFTLDKARTEGLCSQLRHLGLQWGCDTRLDILSPSLLDTMALSGCTSLFFGIESMNPRIQEWIGKRYDETRMKKVAAICRSIGITTNCSLQAGFPDETITSVKQGLVAAKAIGFDAIDVSILTIYPGSQLSKQLGVTAGDYERALRFPPTRYHFHGMEPIYFPGVTQEFIDEVYKVAREVLGESWHSSGFYVEDSSQLGSCARGNLSNATCAE